MPSYMLIKLGSDEYFAEYEQKEGIKYVQDILLLQKKGDSIDKSKTKEWIEQTPFKMRLQIIQKLAKKWIKEQPDLAIKTFWQIQKRSLNTIDKQQCKGFYFYGIGTKYKWFFEPTIYLYALNTDKSPLPVSKSSKKSQSNLIQFYIPVLPSMRTPFNWDPSLKRLQIQDSHLLLFNPPLKFYDSNGYIPLFQQQLKLQDGFGFFKLTQNTFKLQEKSTFNQICINPQETQQQLFALLDPISLEYIKKPIVNMYFQRQKSDQMKQMTQCANSIKSAILNHFMSLSSKQDDVLLDLGVGQGQDLFKYLQIPTLHHLILVDNDSEALSELLNRNTNYIQSLKHKIQRFPSFEILKLDFKQVDLLQTDAISMVVCNFAIHYLLEYQSSLMSLLSKLNSKSLFLCIFFNGDSLLSQMGSKKKELTLKFKNKIVFKYVINANQISLQLPFSSQLKSEQYVSSQQLCDTFKSAGFRLLSNQPFLSYDTDRKYSMIPDVFVTHLSFYTVHIYQKI